MEENTLYNEVTWLNPHTIKDRNGYNRRVERIKIYDKFREEILFEFNWFNDMPDNHRGSDETLKFNSIQRKNKVDLSCGKVFYISVKRRYRFEDKKVELYIPVDKIDYEYVKTKRDDMGDFTIEKEIYKVKGKEMYFQKHTNVETDENRRKKYIKEVIEKEYPIEESRNGNVRLELEDNPEKIKEIVDEIIKVKKMSIEEFNKYRVVKELEKNEQSEIR